MNADTQETAFATLQVIGDRLDPQSVTSLLGLDPTFSVRKGERFLRGRLNREYTGRTGVWNLTTQDTVRSDRLQDHLDALLALLAGKTTRLAQLGEMARENDYRVGVSCYWYGSDDAPEPTIPAEFRAFVGSFGGQIETDFYRADRMDAKSAAE